MTEIEDVSRISGLHKDTLRLIQIAHQAGWKVVKQGSGAIRLIPPDGAPVRPIRIPLSTKQFTGLRRAKRAIAQTLNPIQKAAVVAYVTDLDFEPDPADPSSLFAEPDLATIPIEEEVKERRPKVPKTPTVIKREPWLARKGPGKHGGMLYPSAAVTERTWSDGSVDYECASPGCDYDSASPRSVSAHYGSVHSTGRAPQHPPTAVDPDYTEPVTSRYSPTERMIGLLGEQIRLALAAGVGENGLAEAILVWLHNRPDLDRQPIERAPLTDSEALDRIRVILGMTESSAAESERDALLEENARLAAEVERLVAEKHAVAEMLLGN